MTSRSALVLGLVLAHASNAAALAADDNKSPPPKLSYYALPRTVVDAEVKYELKSCAASAQKADKSYDLTAEVKATATLVVRAEADPALRYALEPGTLANSRTKTDFGLELYENGTIKSLNAASEDRTGAVIGNVLGGIFSIAKLFLGPVPFADGNTYLPHACNADTRQALDRVKTLRGEISQLKEDIRKLEFSKPPAGNDGTADIKRYREKLAILQEQLKETVDNRLTLSVKKVFVPGPKLAERNALLHPTNDQLKEWFVSDTIITMLEAKDAGAAQKQLSLAALPNVKALQVEVAVVPGAVVTTPIEVGTSPTPSGLVLREPVRSQILACRYLCSETGKAPGDPLAIIALARAEADVPQFGDARILPLNVKTFESRTLALTQSPFGRVQTMKWVAGAKAETASGVFKDASGQIFTGVTDLTKIGDTTELEKLKMEKSLYDAERERLEAKKKLEDLLAQDK